MEIMRIPYCVRRGFVIDMRVKRIRYLIAFVVAMFVANNVAAAAYACIAAVKGVNLAAVRALDSSSAKHTEAASTDTESCLTHCAQGDEIQQQDLAAAVYAPVSVPGLPSPRLVARIKPTAPVLALAPRVIGPPLTILFHNLRN
jgi:hypothetical protein